MGNEQNNQTSQYSNYQDNTANVPYQAPMEDPQSNKANTYQIISLICGIAGIVLGCCFTYVGIILGVVGLILAIVGNKQGKNGVGTAGLVCSIVALVLSVIMMIVSLVFGAALIAALEEAGYYY